MDWLEAMNKAVEYLEANITEKLEIEKLARIALSSTFHFQRMYHMKPVLQLLSMYAEEGLHLPHRIFYPAKRLLMSLIDMAMKHPKHSQKLLGKCME